MNAGKGIRTFYKIYDEEAACLAHESGDLTPEESAALFQHLIDNGNAWRRGENWIRWTKEMLASGKVRMVRANGRKE